MHRQKYLVEEFSFIDGTSMLHYCVMQNYVLTSEIFMTSFVSACVRLVAALLPEFNNGTWLIIDIIYNSGLVCNVDQMFIGLRVVCTQKQSI